MFRFCFNSKATQNARYEQMTKQRQLIELKKQEIQRKLDEKKRKETEDALKKLNPQAAGVVDKLGPSSSNSNKQWKGFERKRSSDVLKSDIPSPAGPSNIFSNDGSFLDQFRKITGVKAPKVKKRNDDCSNSKFDDSYYSRSNTSGDRGYSGKNEPGDIAKIKDLKNETSLNNELSDKNRSRRWDRNPEGNLTDHSQPHPVHSQPMSTGGGYQSQPVQPSFQSIMLSPRPPLPPPLSFTQQNNSFCTVYPIPIVPPPLKTSSIPPPAPINPGTIPSPSPILPCSIPSPSPIQPSAIPPPSPIIPHSIPPPSPISLKMIPQPLPLPPHDIPSPPPLSRQHDAISPGMISPSPMISQPHYRNNFKTPSINKTTSNFSSSDLPPLPPNILPLIKYPTPETRLKTEPQKMLIPSVPVGAQHTTIVPAEHTVVEEKKMKGFKEEEEETDEREFDVEQEQLQKRKPLQDLVQPKEENEELPCKYIEDNHNSNHSPFNNIEISNPDSKGANIEDFNNLGTDTSKDGSIDGFPLDESISIKSEPFVTFETGIKIEVPTQQLQQEETSQDGESYSSATAARRKKRRSRWAPEGEAVPAVVMPSIGPIGVVTPTVLGVTPVLPPTNTPTINVPGMKGHLLSQISRTDPALLQYAIQNFGSTQLSEEDWKKAEDHYKINLLYQDMLKKRRELERLEAAGKFKYEYDSDEETEGGTWEHKLREKEMVATQLWADELTEAAKGKHHIGDFLPPEELSRFMEKYEALKQGRPPDLSDYKEYKLKEDNVGFQMLQKLGWTEGQGLGSDGSGIVDPVNKATVRADNQGLGLERPDDVSVGDDEYDAYRKRMMLAYRFRPNPLNNPRRPYY